MPAARTGDAQESHRLDILHITQPTSEGVASVVLDMCRQQVKAGYRVGVISPPDQGFWSQLDDSVVTFAWKAKRKLGLNLLGEYVSLKKLLARIDCHVNHLHSSKAGLLGRLGLISPKSNVFQPNGWSFEAQGGVLGILSRFWERFAAKRLTATLICSCQQEKDSDSVISSLDVAVVLHNAIDLEAWDAKACYSKNHARELLGLDPSARLVVAVGRVAQQKGPDLMLQAWPTILGRIPDAQFRWVGDGPMMSELHSEMEAADGFQFVGLSREPYLWFLAADVIAMPSRWEGHSIAMLESMASRRPVIAFDVSGFGESLGNHAGIVVPAGDIQAFADAVVTMLSHPADRLAEMGEAGRSKVEDCFSVESQFQRLMQIYGLALPHSTREKSQLISTYSP